MSRHRPALLLDEMFSPAIAEALRERGHRATAVAEDSTLRAASDEFLFDWAAQHRHVILTENVRDFRPLLVSAIQSGATYPAIVFTSSRTFPRNKARNGLVVKALESWLAENGDSPPAESWLG